MIQFAAPIVVYGVPALVTYLRLKGQNKKMKEFKKTSDGFIVGRNGERLIYKKEEIPCLIIFGPARRGKSTCFFIPNILDASFDGSMVVFDYKQNELYRQTAKIIEKQARLAIKYEPDNPNCPVQMNPFDICEHNLESLANTLLSAADLSYKTVYGKDFKTGEEAWTQMAQSLVRSYVFHIGASKPNNNLEYFRQLLSMSPKERDQIIKSSPSEEARENFQIFYNSVQGEDGEILSDKMYSGIINTIITKLDQFISKCVCRCTKETTFFPSMLLDGVTLEEAIKYKYLTKEKAEEFAKIMVKNGKKPNEKIPVTLYICIDKDLSLPKYAALNLLNINMLYQALAYLKASNRVKYGKKKVRFVIDEFANIGKIEGLLPNIKLGGHNNFSWVLGAQDISSLVSDYTKLGVDTLLQNSTVICINGVRGAVLEEYFKDAFPRYKNHEAIYDELSSIPNGRCIVAFSNGTEIQVLDMPKSIDPIERGFKWKGEKIYGDKDDSYESFGNNICLNFKEHLDGVLESSAEFTTRLHDSVRNAIVDKEEVISNQEWRIKKLTQAQSKTDKRNAELMKKNADLNKSINIITNEKNECMRKIEELQSKLAEFENIFISTEKLLEIINNNDLNKEKLGNEQKVIEDIKEVVKKETKDEKDKSNLNVASNLEDNSKFYRHDQPKENPGVNSVRRNKKEKKKKNKENI